jgi:phosphate ABC transporter permease protein PstC
MGIYGSAFVSTALVGLILLTLLFQSGPAIFDVGNTLHLTEWNPSENIFGIVPMIVGSLLVMLIALTLAVPTGVLAAIYIAETRSDKIKRVVRSALEILAGIPSIVYGLIGVAYLSLWVADIFNLQTGRLILTAGILLAIMILPTILSLTEDAISNVSDRYKENGRALGLYRHEVITDVILPQAKPDITGAVLLALGRALGETMAVMLVIGSIDRLPDPIYNVLSSGQTITSKLGREVGESAFGSTHFSVLVFMSFILVALSLLLTFLSQTYFKTGRRHV